MDLDKQPTMEGIVQAQQASAGPSYFVEKKKPKGIMKKPFVFIAVIVLIVCIGGGIFYLLKNTSNKSVVDKSKYQAVFITNGQVYFGKVSNEDRKYVNLSNTYYLILKQPLQNQQEGSDNQQDGSDNQQTNSKPEYSLVKLGKELHGPTSMLINRDQILFIENLADDSKVVNAIKESRQ